MILQAHLLGIFSRDIGFVLRGLENWSVFEKNKYVGVVCLLGTVNPGDVEASD